MSAWDSHRDCWRVLEGRWCPDCGGRSTSDPPGLKGEHTAPHSWLGLSHTPGSPTSARRPGRGGRWRPELKHPHYSRHSLPGDLTQVCRLIVVSEVVAGLSPLPTEVLAVLCRPHFREMFHPWTQGQTFSLWSTGETVERSDVNKFMFMLKFGINRKTFN